MRSFVPNAYGSPHGLARKEIDAPAVKGDGVLLSVRAAALHPGDACIMRGTPHLVRFVAGWPGPKNRIPGFDLAGRVEAVGPNVMTMNPVTVQAGELAAASLKLSQERHISSLVVVAHGGRAEGLVHPQDFWRMQLV